MPLGGSLVHLLDKKRNDIMLLVIPALNFHLPCTVSNGFPGTLFSEVISAMDFTSILLLLKK